MQVALPLRDPSWSQSHSHPKISSSSFLCVCQCVKTVDTHFPVFFNYEHENCCVSINHILLSYDAMFWWYATVVNHAYVFCMIDVTAGAFKCYSTY